MIFAVIIIFCCAGCWLCGSCYCTKEYCWEKFENYECGECCDYVCGRDKRRYYQSAWNTLQPKQKLDYFVSFYSRKYKLHAGDDVYRELLRFFDGTKESTEIELHVQEMRRDSA